MERLVCADFFFFQAEDGIRDHCVTGVQTCALPILQTYSILGLGIPIFWLSLMAVYLFFFLLGWVAPPEGRLGILDTPPDGPTGLYQIGRGACRGRGEISVVGVLLKKKKKKLRGRTV